MASINAGSRHSRSAASQNCWRGKATISDTTQNSRRYRTRRLLCVVSGGWQAKQQEALLTSICGNHDPADTFIIVHLMQGKFQAEFSTVSGKKGGIFYENLY